MRFHERKQRLECAYIHVEIFPKFFWISSQVTKLLREKYISCNNNNTFFTFYKLTAVVSLPFPIRPCK